MERQNVIAANRDFGGDSEYDMTMDRFEDRHAEHARQRHALLSVDQMYAADRAAIAGGTPGAELMENAGRAIARQIRRRWKPCPAAILCGPGNNGGDGFVVARHLAGAGWPVRLALLGSISDLKGDAAWAAGEWTGPVETLGPAVVDGAELIVDALFGAGLSRPLDGAVAETLAACRPRWCVAVDVPSGVSGDVAAVDPAALKADLTVTFFRRKPGHLLVPNRLWCGETVVADIGIRNGVLADIAPTQWLNHPDLWAGRLPVPTLADHKYSRGHLLVRGGVMAGAGRLAAAAAARSGPGMVTLAAAAADDSSPGTPNSVIHRKVPAAAFGEALADRKVAAAVLGPGNGVDEACRDATAAALASGKPVVLDADALTVMAQGPGNMFDAIQGPCVLTPHAGEFERLFGAVGEDKLTSVRAAAAQSGAVVVLKGGDTVIAAPDGEAVINGNAPAWLASAGAGDVLAGVTGALLAQGMTALDAACAGAWIHGEAANRAAEYLIADDLAAHIPDVMANLVATYG